MYKSKQKLNCKVVRIVMCFAPKTVVEQKRDIKKIPCLSFLSFKSYILWASRVLQLCKFQCQLCVFHKALFKRINRKIYLYLVIQSH